MEGSAVGLVVPAPVNVVVIVLGEVGVVKSGFVEVVD